MKQLNVIDAAALYRNYGQSVSVEICAVDGRIVGSAQLFIMAAIAAHETGD